MYDYTASLVLYNNEYEDYKNIIDYFENTKDKCLLIIIDNSKNGLHKIESFNKNIEYIKTNKNLGYGSGQNIALKKIIDKSLFHFLLSPDLLVPDEFYKKSINYVKHNQILAFAPKILNYDFSIQQNIKNFPNPINLIIRSLSIFKKLEPVFNKNYVDIDKLYSKKDIKVNCVSGSCIGIDTRVIKKIGFFDERYFMYLEDVDFCLRIVREFNIYYIPKFLVIHKHNASSKKNIKYWIIHVISAIKYFYKWKFKNI